MQAHTVIARSVATKQSRDARKGRWIASSQAPRNDGVYSRNDGVAGMDEGVPS